MKYDRLIIRASHIALTSSHKRFRLGALICSGSRIIAKATNKPSCTHPLQPSHILRVMGHASSTHAELRAIISASPRKRRGSILYVSRILKDDYTLAIAKPCRVCQGLIREAKIGVVVFSTGGTIEQPRYEEMTI